jgi:hypothetical protein
MPAAKYLKDTLKIISKTCLRRDILEKYGRNKLKYACGEIFPSLSLSKRYFSRYNQDKPSARYLSRRDFSSVAK